MAYLLDTSVFIEARNSYYTFEVCPGFWQWIDKSHANGEVMSVSMVRDELLVREDNLAKWCKIRKAFFVATGDNKTYESLRLLSTWVVEKYQPAFQAEFLGSADFPLVGYAHAHSHTVVTNEVFALGKEVKIPNACKEMNVPFMTPFDMLAAEKVEFVLRSN